MHDWHEHGWAGGHWVVAIVLMVLFWGVAAAIAIALVRTRAQPRDRGPGPARVTAPGGDAETILHERFARGEIDEEEYTRRHDLLKERTR